MRCQPGLRPKITHGLSSSRGREVSNRTAEGRQRNRSPASLGVGQLQLTRIEINVLPAQLLDHRKPAAGQHQETNRGYRRAGFRPVLQYLVENLAKPGELLRAQESFTLLLLVALDVQAGV